MNKRGVSELIVTVLIIGITLASFGLVYSFVIPLIREGISTSQACSDAQLFIETARGYTCYDSSTGNINVQVKRGPKEVELSSIQVIVSEGGNTETFDIIGNYTITYQSSNTTNISGLVGYWSFDN